jgi:tRNA dimethylallyltransferase
MKNKICIVLVGPTAVGKTSLAIDLAQNLKTDILSADSRQCYQELNIGVAKPTSLQLEAVHHYFINSHSINEDINAKVFEEYALEKVNEIFSAHDIAIVVGGTGLYVKAFCEGIDEIPQIDKNIREKIIAEYETNGLEWLQNEVRRRDPEYFKVGEIQNPQRMIRALEVMLSTGNSILSFQSKEKKQRDFTILKIGLDLPREILYDNINRRVDEMIKEGLVEEARTLFPNKQLNALQTVGYRELFEYFEGTTSLEKAIENIKTNTRHYAKRQLTWFRKDSEIKWLNTASALPDILSSLRQFT